MPGAIFRLGNLPKLANASVHSGEDVILTATGPGSERVRGQIDNTGVFRIMAEALGLGQKPGVDVRRRDGEVVVAARTRSGILFPAKAGGPEDQARGFAVSAHERKASPRRWHTASMLWPSGIEHEGAVIVRMIMARMPGAPLSRPPADKAALWNASTDARSFAAIATCSGLSSPPSPPIQKSGCR